MNTFSFMAAFMAAAFLGTFSGMVVAYGIAKAICWLGKRVGR